MPYEAEEIPNKDYLFKIAEWVFRPDEP